MISTIHKHLKARVHTVLGKKLTQSKPFHKTNLKTKRNKAFLYLKISNQPPKSRAQK